MATLQDVENHQLTRFKPNRDQEPLVRIAEALEFIADKLHDMSFDLSETQDAIHRVANNS